MIASGTRQPAAYRHLLDFVVFNHGHDEEREYQLRSRWDRFVTDTRRQVGAGDVDLADLNASAVIPSKRNRKVVISHDASIYKHRNQIERCFQPPQAFPSLRYPLRPTHRPLHRLLPLRRWHDLATMNVDPA